MEMQLRKLHRTKDVLNISAKFTVRTRNGVTSQRYLGYRPAMQNVIMGIFRYFHDRISLENLCAKFENTLPLELVFSFKEVSGYTFIFYLSSTIASLNY